MRLLPMSLNTRLVLAESSKILGLTCVYSARLCKHRFDCVIKFEKWGEKEPHTKHICGREDKVLT